MPIVLASAWHLSGLLLLCLYIFLLCKIPPNQWKKTLETKNTDEINANKSMIFNAYNFISISMYMNIMGCLESVGVRILLCLRFVFPCSQHVLSPVCLFCHVLLVFVRPCVFCLCPETRPPPALCHFLFFPLTCSQSPCLFAWFVSPVSCCLVPPYVFKFSLSYASRACLSVLAWWEFCPV